ncbi:CpaF family protein [Kordiimonas aquimaris]|uniref:CpaF family protein n=1 Tax=Kordiimonas aquimaris TaxID=707591 RepID=UPI0021CE6C3D|nr:CpaF family protein [Kordiimonas aquimaris]
MKPQAFGRKKLGGGRSPAGGFGVGFGKNTTIPVSPTDPRPATPNAKPANDTAVVPDEISTKVPEANNEASEGTVDRLAVLGDQVLTKCFTADELRMATKSEVTTKLFAIVSDLAEADELEVSEQEKRDVATYLLNEAQSTIGPIGESDKPTNKDNEAKPDKLKALLDAKTRIQSLLMEHIDPTAAAMLPRPELAEQVGEVVGELLVQEKINLNLKEQKQLVTLLLDDMLGLGPLEPLLADETISDIMVNGPNQVYVEQKGRLTLTDVSFRDNQHLMNIAQRIVTAVGRRVDESSPICDARLADGSRVNVIAPPLAIDGASISIRKFTKDKITLDKMLDFGSISPPLAKVLKIAGACRLNILISGGTGSGKTTMLNALSRMIDQGERVVTIEDAAELQLQQPHVVRLETRPANLEGSGEIDMRDLVKNALRMRPDRIILGEIRGGEAIDMLQAMNTGHDGSMGTIHANRPREALTRLENMVNMAGLNLPPKAIREQVSASLDLIVQVQRMRDGGRRTTHVTEVVGMEGDVITTQDLFKYEFTGEDESGRLTGTFKSTGVRPHFLTNAEYFGLDRALMDAMNG